MYEMNACDSLRRKICFGSRKKAVTPRMIENGSLSRKTNSGIYSSVGDLDSTFKLISRAFYITGVFLPLYRKSNDKGKLAKTLKIIFQTTNDALLHYLVITFARQLIVKNPKMMHITFFVMFDIALVIRFVLRRRHSKIADVVLKMVQFYNEMDDGTGYRRLRIFTIIVVFIALSFPVTVLLENFLLKPRQDYWAQQIEYYFFGLNIKSDFLRCIISMLVFSLILVEYILIFTLIHLAVVLCSSVYMISNQIICKLKCKLETLVRDNKFSDTLVEFHSLANRIVLAVAEIEEAFSLVVFLVYTFLLSIVFCMITVILLKSSLEEVKIYEIIIFIVSTCVFLILTFSASKIPETAAEVKLIIRKIAQHQNVLAEISPCSLTSLLLLSNSFPSDVTLTGWGMFNLNKGLILTVAGVIVSYGVILVQTNM